jgi:hypothetical protein
LGIIVLTLPQLDRLRWRQNQIRWHTKLAPRWLDVIFSVWSRRARPGGFLSLAPCPVGSPMNQTKKKQGTKIERQTSVFAAAANALEWLRCIVATFGTARRFRDEEIRRIGGMAPDHW